MLRESNFYEIFSHPLTFEVQIVWKSSAFQYYWWKYQNHEIKMNFQEFQLKGKILKYFMRSKQQAALRKLFNLPPVKNFLLVSGTKNFWREYTDICFTSASRVQLLGL